MAIALKALKRDMKIETALVLDIDLHFGDGTVNILGDESWVTIHNPPERDRIEYVRNIEHLLSELTVDIIGISAGFDHHVDDWGGLLTTEDYFTIGSMVKSRIKGTGGCFAILEGGYNHKVLGQNAYALIKGLET